MSSNKSIVLSSEDLVRYSTFPKVKQPGPIDDNSLRAYPQSSGWTRASASRRPSEAIKGGAPNMCITFVTGLKL